MDAYHATYARWRRDPESFWAEAAGAVHWDRKWTAVVDRSESPFYRWFPGGLLNTCYNAVDRHAIGARADQLALIYDSPVTGVIRRFTYRELRATESCETGSRAWPARCEILVSSKAIACSSSCRTHQRR
jgi:propionyl-CoA synthetase